MFRYLRQECLAEVAMIADVRSSLKRESVLNI